jgi:hypothetical protein
LCDGTVSKSEMTARLQRRTGLPADEEIVDLALAELADAGLIVLDNPEPLAAVTRRSLIRRFALSAAAVAMLPIVETILVPPASAQDSLRGRDSSFQQACPTPTPVEGEVRPAPTPTPTPTPIPE